MTRLTDEMLVAYVDGELSAEDAAEIERALQADHKVREAVRIFRDSADWSRRAFDDVLREPVPERLIHAATGQGNAGQTEEAPAVLAPRTRSRAGLAGLAMAASVALAIGVGGGFGLSSIVGTGDPGPGGLLLVGAVDDGGGLHAALESAPSGTMIRTADDGDVMPLATFVEHDGLYCREFQATPAKLNGPKAAFGIACRQPAGSWQIEAVVAAPDPARTQSGHFVPASGAEDPVLPLIGAMSDAGPISMSDEAAVLAAGWK